MRKTNTAQRKYSSGDGERSSAPVRKSSRGRRRAKRSRRSMSTLLIAVLITVITMMCLSGFTRAGKGSTAPVSVAPSRYYEVISVRANDTLWDIALRVCENSESKMPASVRDVVHEIMQVNSMSSARIYVGQQIAVPKI